MYKIIYLLCCCFSASFLFSQKNFVPAHLTARDGRTYVGEIDYREWSANPELIRFRPSAEGKVQELGLREVESFQIDHNQEKYIRAEVSMINESIEFAYLPFFRNVLSINHKIPKVDRTVFLRVLAEGAIDLYQYIDQNKRLHYYIQKGNSPMQELTYRVVKLLESGNALQPGMQRGANPHVVTLETYKMELARVMGNVCPEIQGSIGQLPYSNLIQNLVVQYNECVGNSTYSKPKEKSYHAFFAHAGALRAGFSVNDQNNPEDIQMNNALSTNLGIGYEFAVPRSRDKFILGLGFNFFNVKASTSNEFLVTEGALRTIRYALEQKVTQFNIYGKYFPFKVKYAPYIKAGLSIYQYRKNDFSVQDNRPNKYQFSRHRLKKSEMTTLVGVGIQAKNLYTEFRYGSGTDINPTTGYDLKINRWAFILGWRIPLGQAKQK